VLISPELTEACRRGDPDAFDELVRETHRPLYSLILRLVGNPEDAADVLQETYVRSWRNLRRFRGDSDLGTWLHKVATNAALTHLRKRSRAPVPVADEALDRGIEDPGGAEQRGDADLIERALARLSPEQRMAVVLKDMYGWSMEDIAKTVGMTEGAIKLRVFRARRRLAAMLAESGDAPPARIVPMRQRKAR
jgi:RNA polymerase sigma-70 factor (ECF subfamily)